MLTSRRCLTSNNQIQVFLSFKGQNDFLNDYKCILVVCPCQERRMMQMHPYILNVNEDAQLSGVVKLFIEEGRCVSS